MKSAKNSAATARTEPRSNWLYMQRETGFNNETAVVPMLIWGTAASRAGEDSLWGLPAARTAASPDSLCAVSTGLASPARVLAIGRSTNFREGTNLSTNRKVHLARNMCTACDVRVGVRASGHIIHRSSVSGGRVGPCKKRSSHRRNGVFRTETGTRKALERCAKERK